MKNLVKFKSYKDGSLKVSISDGLMREEFERVSELYGLPDESIHYFKRDALQLILVNCIQGWISNFKCDAKNDYMLYLNDQEFHVVNGECVYEQDFKDHTEDMVEVGADFNQIEN